MKTKLSLLALALSTALAAAAPMSFDFKDPKGVNNVVFQMDAPLESINGTGTGVSGTVMFDPEKPGDIKGKIVLATKSLHVSNPMMLEHMHGPDWMNVAQHPEITFEAVSSKNVKTKGNVTTADVTGKLTIKGVTKDVTVPVTLTFLKDKLKDRSRVDGDLLVLRTKFNVKRSDYGINSSKSDDKVANEIELSLSIAGAAPKKA